MSEFYDENWKKLVVRNSLVARVIEHCYELCLGYDQYEEEKEEMIGRLESLMKARNHLFIVVDQHARDIQSLTLKVEKLEPALKELMGMLPK